MSGLLYTIDDLQRMTGVPRRTIRLYIQRGLVPPALGRGRGRHYGEAHRIAIQRVQDLKRAGRKLDDIKMGGRQLQEPMVGSAAQEEPSGGDVTRILLAEEGVWLEVGPGVSLPSQDAVEQLADLCRRELGLGNNTPEPGVVIVNRLDSVLFISNGLGNGRSLRLRPGEHLEIPRITPAIEKAEASGQVTVLGQPE